MIPEIAECGVGSIWRKRVAPLAFELRRIDWIGDKKVIASTHGGSVREFYHYEFFDLYAPLVKDESQIIFAGVGHRPEHIATGRYTLEETREKIYDFYVDLLKWIRVKEVISGLARGFDMWLAWAALESDTRLIGARPYPGQTGGWQESDRQEWNTIWAYCAEQHTVCETYHSTIDGTDNAYLERNRWMVDRSTHLTSFWQGTRGGTAWTNDYAVARGKPRLVINGMW